MWGSRRFSTIDSTEEVNMDCKPVAFLSLMLVSFWLMLSYLTNSYFIIFLIFSNFILLFACCVSLSGYVLRRYIDARQEQPGITDEITTISGRTPYIMPEYPPSYEEAVRNVSMVPCRYLNGRVNVPTCVICASHQHIKETRTQEQNIQNNSSSITSSTSNTLTTSEALTSTPILITSGCRSSIRTTSSSTSTNINSHLSSSISTISSTNLPSTPSSSTSNLNLMTPNSEPSVQCGEPPPCYDEEIVENTETNTRNTNL